MGPNRCPRPGKPATAIPECPTVLFPSKGPHRAGLTVWAGGVWGCLFVPHAANTEVFPPQWPHPGLEKPQRKSHQEVSFPLSSRLIRKGSSPRVREVKQKHYMLLTGASLSCTGPLGVGQETVPVWQSSHQGVRPGQPGMRHAIL